jgi:hypothetical protein
VHDGYDGWVLESKGDASNGLDTSHEPFDKLALIDIQNVWGEGRSIVIDHRYRHTVCERRDVQHVQEGSFGWSDLGTSNDDFDVRHDFDRTTGNLGGDLESLEERGLSGFHTSVTSGHSDVYGGNGTSTGRGLDLVGDNDLAHILEVTRGEDEANVALNVGEETFVLWVLGEDVAQSTADHGVFAHQDDTLATESSADLMHLVRTDVIDIDDEDCSFVEDIRYDVRTGGCALTVSGQKLLELGEVNFLLCTSGSHFYFYTRLSLSDLSLYCTHTLI